MTAESTTPKTVNISMEGLTLRVADVECSLAFYQMLPSGQA